MSRLAGLALVVGATIALAVVGVSRISHAPRAPAERCAVGDQRSYGTTYVLRISVSLVGCDAARKVIRAFHACRPGKQGSCRRRVAGYRCRERRFNSSAISYDSRVSCRRGAKRVRHTFTQFI